MNITQVTEVSLDNISSNHKTRNGIGLCFFDPLDETLKEFNPTTRIPIYPEEKSERKFFLLKDDITLNPNIAILKVSNTSPYYTVKIATDQVLDFSNIPENNVVIDFFSKYPNGIMPVTIQIESLTTSLEYTTLEIDIEIQ